jgi:hypothetical protein
MSGVAERALQVARWYGYLSRHRLVEQNQSQLLTSMWEWTPTKILYHSTMHVMHVRNENKRNLCTDVIRSHRM